MDLEQSIQRFHISPEALNSKDKDETQEPTIPILERSIQAAASSQTLADVSPICVIVVGMAGSGKTTLMAALQRSVIGPKSYQVNLDPATKLVPFGASIDIRDTVDYKVRY